MSVYSSAAPGIHLQNLVLDSSTTLEQKIDCLKLLKIVLKNLADPVKVNDPKYRQLRLANETIQRKLTPCCPSAVDYLRGIGFIEETIPMVEGGARGGPEKVLRVTEQPDLQLMKASLAEITNALEHVGGGAMSTTTTISASQPKKKPRTTTTATTNTTMIEDEKKSEDEEDVVAKAKTSTTTTTTTTTRLSEKQKARVLKEEREKQEREEARKHRAKQVALLKVDKHVRENDENWTSGVSAAASKSGTGMSTFRDRFGES